MDSLALITIIGNFSHPLGYDTWQIRKNRFKKTATRNEIPEERCVHIRVLHGYSLVPVVMDIRICGSVMDIQTKSSTVTDRHQLPLRITTIGCSYRVGLG